MNYIYYEQLIRRDDSWHFLTDIDGEQLQVGNG